LYLFFIGKNSLNMRGLPVEY